MTTIGESAKAYSPQQMGNIADLEVVSTDTNIKEETRINSEREEYKVSFITVDGREYRVPASVLEQLKTIIEEKPDLKTFQVKKTGEGMGTKYIVIPIA